MDEKTSTPTAQPSAPVESFAPPAGVPDQAEAKPVAAPVTPAEPAAPAANPFPAAKVNAKNDPNYVTPEKGMTAEEATEERNKKAAALRAQGGAIEPMLTRFPSLVIEHSTTRDAEPNPNRGHFSINHKNESGDWERVDLGPSVKIQVILQKYFFKTNVEKTLYSSREFTREEKEHSPIALFAKGPNDDRSSLFEEGLVKELMHNPKFMAVSTDKNGKTRPYSKLMPLYALYCRIFCDDPRFNGEIVDWRTNVSGSIGYRFYQRAVNAFAVITELTTEEKISGTVKFYVPKFKAVGDVEDLDSAIDEQNYLIDLTAPQSTYAALDTAEDEDIPSILDEPTPELTA